MIDWSIPCPSIFDRRRPLSGPTMARIARGLRQFVIEAERPFVAPLGAAAVPYLIHRSNGERPGQAPRTYDPTRPLGTIVAQGVKHALVVAYLARHYSDRPGGGWPGGISVDRPLSTITTRDHHALVGLTPGALAELGVTWMMQARVLRSDHGYGSFAPAAPVGDWRDA